MRKLLLMVLITVVLLGVMMVPAQAAVYDSCITTNPLGDIFLLLNATYETTIFDPLTVYAGAQYLWVGFGVGGGVNFYFSGEALNGFYAGGGVAFATVLDSGGFGYNVHAGYKWILDSGFVIDGRVGYGGIFFYGFEVGFAF